MVVAGDFKNGITFDDGQGNVLQVIEFQHVKPGKGAAFVRTKLKNVISGAVVSSSCISVIFAEIRTVKTGLDSISFPVTVNDGTYAQVLTVSAAMTANKTNIFFIFIRDMLLLNL